MFADVCKIDVTLPDFYKIDVLKDFAMLKESTGTRFCFDKVTALKHLALLQKRHQRRCFPVNFMEFLRTAFLQHFF